ncbi:TPA: hydrogenase, partial [Candidatus Woesearchaeota archaeon]|nr:hydrogenase [Candidatus Woesearchaeota archaeon]
AFLQGRKGPGLLQAYYSLWKLFKKEVVYSSNSSFIMRVAPYISIISALVAALFVPLLFIPDDYSGFGNIILLLYILAVGKFFMALGGLDAGSAFGGMGSSREMSISSMVEPVVIVLFAAIAFVFRSTNLFEILREASHGLGGYASLWLLLIPLVIVLLTETARIPIDNPETHLELTMVHEAMILEQSGRNLALLEIASAIKQLLLMGIIINLFMPMGFNLQVLFPAGILIAFGAFAIKGAFLAASIGVIESSVAKLRLFRLPNLFALSFFLSVVTIMMEVLL